jgi:hypothetical protein
LIAKVKYSEAPTSWISKFSQTTHAIQGSSKVRYVHRMATWAWNNLTIWNSSHYRVRKITVPLSPKIKTKIPPCLR